MTGKSNVAASIRQRLLNLARERGQDFQQMWINYALGVMESSSVSECLR